MSLTLGKFFIITYLSNNSVAANIGNDEFFEPDIESLPFIEAVRQTRFELGSDHVVAIHLTLIPYLKAAEELKTKPTQHSVKELLEAGIQPDILVCRTEHGLNDEIRRKLALFCNVQIDHVIESLDVDTIYDVPMLMLKEKQLTN